MKAERTGFKTEAREGLALDVAQEEVVNLTLQLGQTVEQVVVTGEAPLVNVTNSSLGGTVHQEQLAELPLNGRNYIDLVLLQKGTAKAAAIGNGQGTSGTWYSSNGAPMRSNNVLLDGARLNNAYSGASGNESGTTLGVDGIQEYKVITDSFSAEYGMSMGSQLVMVSKGGQTSFMGPPLNTSETARWMHAISSITRLAGGCRFSNGIISGAPSAARSGKTRPSSTQSMKVCGRI